MKIYIFLNFMQGVSKKSGIAFQACFEVFRGFRSKKFISPLKSNFTE